MKKLVSITFICILLIACKKHTFDEALPKITLKSIAPYNGNDSVLLITAEVTSKGASDIEYTGFSFSTNPKVDITENQILFQQSSIGTYTATITIYKDSSYYFKAFAANSFGYTASNVLTYLYTGPPAFAPCTLTNNQINDNSTTYTVNTSGSPTNSIYGKYTVTVTGSETITIYFTGKPHNGIYTTSPDGFYMSGNQVYITINDGTNLYSIYQGESLYVAVNSNGSTTLSACTLTYDMGYNPSWGTNITGTMFGEVTY